MSTEPLSGLAERDALRRFAQEVMRYWPEGWGIEGDDLQKIAVKHGLLVPETLHEPCSEECSCAGLVDADDWLDGVECYRAPAPGVTPTNKEQP